jgi:lipopolysaccharide transport system permease protein
MSAGAEAFFRLDAAAPQRAARALADLRDGFGQWRLALALARLDLRNRYRGSVLGPFWLTLSTVAMLIGLGFLYSALLSVPLVEYLPHLAVSLVVWQAMAGFVTDSTGCLTAAEAVIRQLPLPYTVHVLRCLFRNAITAAHSLPLILIVFVLSGTLPGPEALLALPGLVLILLAAFAAALFLGMLCARFRDIVQIVANIMQLAFFLTPILWKPELLKGLQWLLPLNPFYALLETVRGPLLAGGGPWAAWAAAVLYTAAAWAVALAFFIRFRHRLAFWV